MSRAKWSASDWYGTSNFFLYLGFVLTFCWPTFLAALLSRIGIGFWDIPSSAAVIMGLACWLIVIIHRLEAILEQISHIDFEGFVSLVKRHDHDTERTVNDGA